MKVIEETKNAQLIEKEHSDNQTFYGVVPSPFKWEDTQWGDIKWYGFDRVSAQEHYNKIK